MAIFTAIPDYSTSGKSIEYKNLFFINSSSLSSFNFALAALAFKMYFVQHSFDLS